MAHNPSTAALLDRIAKVSGLRPNQSELFQWFVENHKEFAASLPVGAPAGWSSIAATLSEHGFRKPSGDDLTANYVRQVWWKADRKVKKRAPPPPPPLPSREPERRPFVTVNPSVPGFGFTKIKE